MGVNNKFNVAICMYGQWREGDVCAPYIKEFFRSDDSNVHVDYFCSVKDYDLHGNFDYEFVQHDTATLLDKIHNYYNPKHAVITNDALDCNYNYHGKKYVSMTDAIMLKRKYELQYDFTYDIVILTRYDTLIRPLEYFRNLIKCIKNYNDVIHNKNIVFAELKDFKFTKLGEMGHNVESWGHDLLVGVNHGLDLFASECMKLADFSTDSYVDIDPHFSITWAMSNTHTLMQLSVLPHSRSSDDAVHLVGNIVPTHNNFNDLMQPKVTFVRPGFDWSDHPNIFAEYTFDTIHDFYITAMNNINAIRLS